MKTIQIANRTVGDDQVCFIIAEIGINHNGSLDMAKRLIDMASVAGCDAVKFQKRTVDKVYSAEELAKPRESVFGETNGDLKYGLEFSYEDYVEIDKYCKDRNIIWFASCWDEDSVDFIQQFDPPCYKIASASITDEKLLLKVKNLGKPILLSTGMSTMEEIDRAVSLLKGSEVIIYHCTSSYPNELEEINLKVIQTLKDRYDCLVGYSGHEKGILATSVSVMLGACSVERHITVDRTLWGSDQAASLEPRGLILLVRNIHSIPILLGDGVKKVYESEVPIRKKLRRTSSVLIN
ncbi:MAG: N-acetylneuraminate synthase family protein [Vampirovibrionia bacterium]